MILLCEQCCGPILVGELYRRVPRIRYRRDEEAFDQVFVYEHATAIHCPAWHLMSADPTMERAETSNSAA